MKIFLLLLCLLEHLPLISAIFGGEYVSTAYEFPWMARLIVTKKTLTEYGLTLVSGTCGGSIISPNVILTAAHCLENATKIQVQLGHYDSNSYLAITGVLISEGDKNYRLVSS